MGLPGSGKTWFAQRLSSYLDAAWFNADAVRKMANDWDFSEVGRRRQASRMFHYATFEATRGRVAICDFICPTHQTRKTFGADIIIWLNTVDKSRYEDTNRIFEPVTAKEGPKIEIKERLLDHQIKDIAEMIKRDYKL